MARHWGGGASKTAGMTGELRGGGGGGGRGGFVGREEDVGKALQLGADGMEEGGQAPGTEAGT